MEFFYSCFFFFFLVPIHLKFHDVDPSFMYGMLSKLSDEYSGEYSVNVLENMKYPTQIEYDEKQKYLSSTVKKLKLRSSGDFNRVNCFLKRLERVGIPTDDGNNNMFRAVWIQLHCPERYTDDMFWHQIASYMVEIVDFLHPIIKEYLDQMNISFKHICYGSI